ncbi:MAG: hypothetical protein AAFO72_01820 [Pseudomonadota bacterium]
MRPRIVIAHILLGIFCVHSDAARADSPAEFETLDAALTLWEFGLSEERADLAMSAIEVVADLAPTGAGEWVSETMREVRLMALGDASILMRADSLVIGPENPRLGLAIPQSDLQVLTLPERTRLGRLRTPLGSQLSEARTAENRDCRLDLQRVSDCAARHLSGRIALTWVTRGTFGVIAYDMIPQSQSGADQ